MAQSWSLSKSASNAGLSAVSDMMLSIAPEIEVIAVTAESFTRIIGNTSLGLSRQHDVTQSHCAHRDDPEEADDKIRNYRLKDDGLHYNQLLTLGQGSRRGQIGFEGIAHRLSKQQLICIVKNSLNCSGSCQISIGLRFDVAKAIVNMGASSLEKAVTGVKSNIGPSRLRAWLFRAAHCA